MKAIRYYLIALLICLACALGIYVGVKSTEPAYKIPHSSGGYRVLK